MAHFITGLYYFTGFQIFLIIITGFVVGQALVSIYDLVQAIRHNQSIKPKIYMLIPWLVVSIILLLSPVYSSNLGSAWMLIFAVIEIIAAILTRKIFNHHQRKQTNDEQLNTEAVSSDSDFADDYNDDRNDYNPGVSRNIESKDDRTDISDEPQQSQEPAVSQRAESQTPVSAAPASSQPASSASQAQSAASSAASAASQPVSQAAKSDEDDMDKLFDYNENTDAELAEEAKERQEKAESDQANIVKRLSEMEADHDKAN